VESIKAMNIRMPKSMWAFLKKQTVLHEKSMNAIILECLKKYKEDSKKKVDSE
jgi:predicted HicB family RNase H-like nuclease